MLDRLDRFDLHMAVATEYSRESLATEGWDERVLAKLFEISLILPSINDIKDDLPELSTQILQHLVESGEVPRRTLSTAALNALRTRPWPGGYAELRSAIKSLSLATLEEEIGASEVRKALASAADSNMAAVLPLDMPLREARETFERMYFEYHLRLESGNMTRLAEKTGLERTHLYRKLKHLGLPVGRRSEEN